MNTSEQINLYIELIQKWNKVYNLTAAKSAAELMTHHVNDSLSVIPYLQGDNVLDVGSGAGFPGIPLAISLPQIKFTLLDSQSKKVRFLNQVTAALELQNVNVVHARIEDYKPEQCFSTVITRATFSAKELFEKTARLLCPEGIIVLMKGKYPEAELAELENSVDAQVQKIQVPNLDAERHIIVIKNQW